MRMANGEWRMANGQGTASMDRNTGQMLIIVLWVMGLVSLAVGSLSVQTTHALRMGRIPLESLQRRAIAEAAVQHALALVARDDVAVDHLGEPWATGQEHEQPVLDQVEVGEGLFRIGITDADGTFTAGLIDEERKINVNTAGADVLRRLIESANVPDVVPQQIADALSDWRMTNDPEAGVCAEQHPPCHNGPLDSIDELLLVPGMTTALFDALQPHVTVYGYGAVNVNTASAVVLDALGCLPNGETLVEQRAGATPPVLAPSVCPGTVGISSAFAVPVEAWLSQASPQTHLRAVIRRDGTILAWASQ